MSCRLLTAVSTSNSPITFFGSLRVVYETDPTAYQNIIAGIIQNPQTIWLRAADVNSSCVVDTGSVTLDLIVNPLPSPIAPDPLEVCDVDNDGFGEFILTCLLYTSQSPRD